MPSQNNTDLKMKDRIVKQVRNGDGYLWEGGR
jgi:hypothetical protein